mmetsp:Transcript_27116/g.75795  ORF Transcript_27116/g.75795 Transcript_27116/m.75795 type:complete len:580 (+) Transcript_27116:28-1767(+)
MGDVELEENSYDAVIVGTGLGATLVSGALAREGKRVLHLDRREHYGAEVASLHLDGLVHELKEGSAGECPSFEDVELLDAAGLPPGHRSRDFSLDLTPRGVFAVSPLIDALLHSGITSYVDFKIIRRAYISLNEALHVVPSSKADIFQSQILGLMEKRKLGNFLQFCLPPNFLSPDASTRDVQQRRREKDVLRLPDQLVSALRSYEGKSFECFLEDRKLSPKLRGIVMHAIAGIREPQSGPGAVGAVEGARRMMRYILSVHRYGPTPFIYPMYGVAEFPQALARFGAVNGATFILNKAVADRELGEDGSLRAIVLDGGTRIRTRSLISTRHDLPASILPPARTAAAAPRHRVARCICIVPRTVAPPPPGEEGSADEATSEVYVTLPPGAHGNVNAVSVLQLSSGMGVTPRGLFAVHFTTVPAPGVSARDALSGAVAFLLGDLAKSPPGEASASSGEPTTPSSGESPAASTPAAQQAGKPPILWGCYFTHNYTDQQPADGLLPHNVHVLSTAVVGHNDNGFGCCIEEAREIFQTLCGKHADFLADTKLKQFESNSWNWWEGEWDGNWWQEWNRPYWDMRY